MTMYDPSPRGGMLLERGPARLDVGECSADKTRQDHTGQDRQRDGWRSPATAKAQHCSCLRLSVTACPWHADAGFIISVYLTPLVCACHYHHHPHAHARRDRRAKARTAATKSGIQGA